jgi:hypothetical protein
MTAFLIVRAMVPDGDRDKFDHWYETEHLPDALSAFKALSAKRGWSNIEPQTHLAFYEFPDLATAEAISSSDAIAALITEFDRVWQDRVKRTRDVVEISQSL